MQYLTQTITFRTDPAKLSEVIESFDTYPRWNALVPSLHLMEGGAVEDGAKVRGTLSMGGRERQVKGSIGTYRAHRQMRLNFASMLYRTTIEYALQWRHQEATDAEGVPEGPADVTVTLRFSYESGMPVVGSLLDRFAHVEVSEETLKSSLEGLKAHSELPRDATGR